MICRQCQRENPPQNAFCHTCGAPIPSQSPAPMPEAQPVATARCQRCGTENAKTMQFCRTCGSDLIAARAAEPRSGAAPPLANAAQARGQGGAGPSMSPRNAAMPERGAMPVSCPRCGGANDAASRFCKFCGVPFEGASVGAPVAPASLQPPPAQAGGLARGQVVVIQRDGSEGTA